jgi:hypothetical protein
MAAFAARLYFDDGPDSADVVGDSFSIAPISIDSLHTMTVKDIVSIRRDGEEFNELRRILAACKAYIESLPPTTDQRRLSIECKSFIRDEIERSERSSRLRFVEETALPGIVFSLAVGVAFLSAAPIVGLVASAVLTPRTLRAVMSRRDPKRRALARAYSLF